MSNLLSRYRLQVTTVGAMLVLTMGGLMWLAISQNRTIPGQTRDQFAQDRDLPMQEIPFDGKRAMRYLEALCELGPRISGSEGMKRQQMLLTKHFEQHGAKVTRQVFEAKQRSQPKPVEMVNLIASWFPDRKRRVIFCGHYDTRPIADQEPRRQDWTKPFLSANDGTSTMAWLMELAHHMKGFPTAVGVDFVCFDGEEYIFNPSPDVLTRDRYFIGSEHFANEYRRHPPQHIYTAAILLDLFAHKNARYPVEENSRFGAGKLVEEVWTIAKELKVDAFRWERGLEIQDDHLALQRVGIPAIDIIDFDYPHWHRLSDTPDKCDPAAFERVGRVLTVWLQRQK